ncbi:MAG TPA: MFS transporter [Thermoanaerobaculia bacterium]
MSGAARRKDPTLIALIAEGFLSRLSFGIIGFALPLYAHHLGMSIGMIGVLASLSVIAELMLKPFASALADRLGFKRALASAVMLRSSVGLLFALAAAPWQLLTIRFMHGAAESLRDPSVNSILAEHGGRKAVASAFAWYSTAKNVAGSIGKAAAGILLTLTVSNYTLVFLIAFILSALPLGVIVRFVTASPAGTEKPGEAEQSPCAPTPKRAIAPFVFLGVLISGTAAMLSNLFPILATQYAHLTEAQAGLIYAASTTLIIFAGPAFGWLSDNVSRKLVLVTRSVANIVSSIAYLVAPTLAGVAGAKITDDIGKAAFRPAWGAVMAQLSDGDRARRARTVGWLGMGENVGEAAGPLLAGLLWSVWGVAAVLIVRAVLAVFTEIYAITLRAGEDVPHPLLRSTLSRPPERVEIRVPA